jgi:hypothetical protein
MICSPVADRSGQKLVGLMDSHEVVNHEPTLYF